jgi:hypothetical protein
LPPRFDLERILHDFLDLFPAQLVDIADLVGIHEARITHHVATIGEVNGEHRATTVFDCAGTMVVESFIVVSPNVATWKVLFDPFQELHIFGHHVFKLAVFRAVFHHPNLTVALQDRRFDLADVIGDETPVIFLAVDDLLTCLLHTSRTERICRAGPPQRRLGFFPGFQKWLIRPLRCE